jgi:hypothetical protein
VRGSHTALRSFAHDIGGVVDSAGDPASGIIVTLLVGTRGRMVTRYRKAETDDHGEYRIDGVATGLYYLPAPEWVKTRTQPREPRVPRGVS